MCAPWHSFPLALHAHSSRCTLFGGMGTSYSSPGSIFRAPPPPITTTCPCSYQKGASVIRMLEGFIGKDAFKEGMRLYVAVVPLPLVLPVLSSRLAPCLPLAPSLRLGPPTVRTHFSVFARSIRERRHSRHWLPCASHPPHCQVLEAPCVLECQDGGPVGCPR